MRGIQVSVSNVPSAKVTRVRSIRSSSCVCLLALIQYRYSANYSTVSPFLSTEPLKLISFSSWALRWFKMTVLIVFIRTDDVVLNYWLLNSDPLLGAESMLTYSSVWHFSPAVERSSPTYLPQQREGSVRYWWGQLEFCIVWGWCLTASVQSQPFVLAPVF